MLRSVYYLIVVALFFFCSCGNTSDRKQGKEQDTLSAKVKNGYADLQLIDEFYDFGSIVQGEVVSHTFRFRNAGTDVLIVKDIIPDCGCTKTKTETKLLKPNEEGTIEVIFNSSGWSGSQYKSIAIRTNSPIRDKSVTIKANVVVQNE